MEELYFRTFKKFIAHGTAHREQVKNEKHSVMRMCKLGMIRKAYHRGRVFYELTPKSAPLLEHCRKMLLECAYLEAAISRSLFYNALLHDLRGLDTSHPLAERFMFLGDWQITRPVVPSQLELSILRHYQFLGLA
jgi:hypothetical protein